ncbi:solute carrier family 10 member 6-like [Polyodon spathula]|uniref:solute carrier family 10 member 6-like n=1 Tax=Polyodon spathula TaxID=7913 RepID=UPI001B7F2D2D|nr:solute carrier family 10 member 6-like [Polyodon spathula]
MLNCSIDTDCQGNVTGNETAEYESSDDRLSFAFSVVLTVMLALVVFSLGCTLEVGKLWFHLRRPWGIIVGIVCQFGLMPLIAYLLSVGFSVKPAQAVAVLIMGCCPGGITSNMITYWTDGDMDLSIAMTSCSTVLGMGMMPLCLYIYTQSWVQTGSIKIPYLNIGFTLVTLIAPVSCGVFVNYKWPRLAKIILKVGSVAGCLLIIVVGTASAVLYKGSWNTDTPVLIIGIIYPMIGYMSGFLLAVSVRQPWQRCRTIAMETGAQNVQICSTVLQLSFPPKQLVLMFTFPIIYGSFQLLDGLVIVAVYQIYKRIFQNNSADKLTPEAAVMKESSVNGLHGELNIAFENEQAARNNSNQESERNQTGEEKTLENTKV